MGEEMEHASMLLEQIRRRGGDFERFLKTYLFTDGSILQEEKAATAEGASKAGSQTGRGGAHPQLHDRLTEGSLDDGTTSIAVSRICRTQSGERLTRLRPRLRATGLPVGGFSNCRALRHEPHLNRSRERRSLPPAVGRRSRRGQGARHFGADAAASVSSQRAADCRVSGKWSTARFCRCSAMSRSAIRAQPCISMPFSAKADGSVVGGHLIEAYVRPTLEVI